MKRKTPLLLALAASLVAGALTVSAKEQLVDVNCFDTDNINATLVRKNVEPPSIVGDKTLMVREYGTENYVLYVLPDGAACAITPVLAPLTENNNKNDEQPSN